MKIFEIAFTDKEIAIIQSYCIEGFKAIEDDLQKDLENVFDKHELQAFKKKLEVLSKPMKSERWIFPNPSAEIIL